MESNLQQYQFCCLVKIAHSRIIVALCPPRTVFLLRPVRLYLFVWPAGQKAAGANSRIVAHTCGAVFTRLHVVVASSQPLDVDVHPKRKPTIPCQRRKPDGVAPRTVVSHLASDDHIESGPIAEVLYRPLTLLSRLPPQFRATSPQPLVLQSPQRLDGPPLAGPCAGVGLLSS